MRRIGISILSLLLAIILVPVFPQTFASADKFNPTNETAVGKDGMVVTAHPEASKIGAKVLQTGGNAMDAAIAVQFALNVTEPMMSGIGGGGFMMVYDAKTKDISIINSRERAPAGATPDMFLDENGKPIPFAKRHTHGNAVGVPGTLAGLYEAHEKWGTKKFHQLIQPSIKLADKGVKVNWVLADAIKDNKNKLAKSAAKDVFLPNGEPLKEGDILVQKDLARTFKLIQKQGPDVFYHGEVAQAIAGTVQDFGGSMTADDLKNYRLTVDKPLYSEYKGYEVASMPPPSSGGLTVLQILKLLEPFNISQYGIQSPEKYHLLAEAMHLAYADRGAYMGDPEFIEIPVKGLLHPDYIAERSSLIRMDQANPNVQPGDPWAYEDGRAASYVEQNDEKAIGQTTHFTVADKWGNIVTYTTTIEQLFGTGIMVPGYGIMLNNELTDFDAVPGGSNEVQPNKRPLSSMSPTMLLKDGEPFMTVGSPGGPTIITSVLQTILNVVDYDMDLKSAIEEPRIYSNQYPNIRWEPGVPDIARARLAQMGHRWDAVPGEIGNVQALMVDPETGLYYGAADSSREGSAIGLGKKKKGNGKGHDKGKGNGNN
ncbi:gamma-glutamyltransferase [Siminovitchia acidinfaciens]|uniref:Glutathione hydrolase proenzyme n=1 Tax=Siminovitchia acidinfaciens TaxID=2321395 RepID=A0A429XZK7_9BACI|nr:gamma-glutamyltransferase [Siminovitchia acidinfaciens]RST74226.1 gamma-glutamyltransferase [Siminovitchia acidinfaciens]